MYYIIDIILVCLIVLIIILGAKKGFVATLTDLVAGILAVVTAKIVSSPVADILYNNVIRNIVLDFISEKYAEIEVGLASLMDNAFSVFDFLPEGIYTFISQAGIFDSEAISNEIISSITSVEQLESEVVAPILISVLGLICFAGLSIVFTIVFRIVGRLVAKIIKISNLADKLDSLLGAVFGLIKGCLYVFIIAAVISVASFASETLAAYTADSFICSIVATLLCL